MTAPDNDAMFYPWDFWFQPPNYYLPQARFSVLLHYYFSMIYDCLTAYIIFHCALYYRFSSEQGEHLHYSHNRFYLNCTSHGGGKGSKPEPLQLIMFDFRRLVKMIPDTAIGRYQDWLAEAEERQRYLSVGIFYPSCLDSRVMSRCVIFRGKLVIWACLWKSSLMLCN